MYDLKLLHYVMIAVPRKLTDVVKANLDDYRESNPDKTNSSKGKNK